MQMKNLINKTVATVLLVSLMFSAAFSVFSSTNATLVPAQITSIPSNMLQYEWTQTAADPERSFFSAGPAPNSPSILWKDEIPFAGGPLVAFNGLIFVQNLVNGDVYALDGGTGSIVWKQSFASLVNPYQNGIGMCKIDNNYMLIGNTCVKIADGSTVWVGPAGFFYGQSVFNGAGYVPELKMFVDPTFGWNLPDPSQPPTLAWNRASEQNVDAGFCTYGDGKVFIGSYDGFLRAVNATTGKFIWKTPITTGFFYGASYYNGMLIQGGLDNKMKAWNANTGKLLWTYDPGTWYGQWATSPGVAYGMVYEHNQDTYLYAINATTGKLVWRAKGPGIGYSNILAIADGKVYCQMGERQYRDFETGEFAYSEFDCYDAYTGKLLWYIPMENGAPLNRECIAYGNLYVAPTLSPSEPGVWTYTNGAAGPIGEIWCIGSTVADWPMFMKDPAHTGYGSGPTNLALKWAFQTGAQIVSSPTCVNGVVYIGSLDSNVYAVSATTGTKKWNFTTGFSVVSSQAVVNGKVYTGADDGNIYCLDATTGNQLWKTPAGGITNSLLGGTIGAVPVRSSPIVLSGKVYVGSLDGNAYCLDANSGTVLWKFQTGGVILAAPAADDSAVYIASCTQPTNGTLYKLNASSGAVIWSLAIPYELTRTLGLGNYIFATPTVAAGMVFVRNGLLHNYAINATTGKFMWTYSAMYNPGTPTQSGGTTQNGAPLYVRGAIYINDYYSITCLNATDGTPVWSTYLSREDLAAAITYSYGRIYVVTVAGVLYVLDSLTGEKVSYHEFGTLQMQSAPTPYNGSLYLGANDWNLYCFGEARLMSAAASQASSSMQEQATSVTSVSTVSTPIIACLAVIGVAVIAVTALLLKRRK